MPVDPREEALFTELRRIIGRELEIPLADLDLRASLRRDYHLDSVAALNILFEIERAYDIDVDPSVIVAVDTLEEAQAALAQLILL